MSKPDVTIKICGVCGSGKTTIAQIIIDALSNKGIDVEYKDPDNAGMDMLGMLFVNASENLKDKIISIEEIQLRRSGYSNE